ncbi:Sm-like protein LSM7, partial [Linum perenne]
VTVKVPFSSVCRRLLSSPSSVSFHDPSAGQPSFLSSVLPPCDRAFQPSPKRTNRSRRLIVLVVLSPFPPRRRRFSSSSSSPQCRRLVLPLVSEYQVKMSGRKETVLDLAKFVDKGVSVKLTGGRQVTGTLKGYDQLLNLVLDEAVEFLRDSDDPLKTTDQTRTLGLIVCRGTAVMLVSPTDGTDEIANPFVQPDGA